MIKVRIGDVEREFTNKSESWINQQINRRRADRIKVCVKVTILQHELNMILMTSNCPRGGGGKQPNHFEKKVFELWEKRGLNSEDFTGGNLIAFLKQL